MNQNGGSLTPQQQQQIDSELHGVNKHINRDVRYDANGIPASAPAWQNNNYPAQGQWQNPQWQNGQQQWQSANPQQWQNGSQQQLQNHGGHHHHHGYGGGNGYGASNGYNASNGSGGAGWHN